MSEQCVGVFRPQWDVVERCQLPRNHKGHCGPMAIARRTDPLTSHLAAASITSERIRKSQAEVLQLLALGPSCDEGIAERALTYNVRQSPSGLRTRRNELVDLGQVIDSGERVRLRSGRMSIVWGLAAQRVAV